MFNRTSVGAQGEKMNVKLETIIALTVVATIVVFVAVYVLAVLKGPATRK